MFYVKSVYFCKLILECENKILNTTKTSPLKQHVKKIIALHYFTCNGVKKEYSLSYQYEINSEKEIDI